MRIAPEGKCELKPISDESRDGVTFPRHTDWVEAIFACVTFVADPVMAITPITTVIHFITCFICLEFRAQNISAE